MVYDDEIYVVSAMTAQPPFRYRLLASRPEGTRFQWVDEALLEEVDSYLRPRDDTPDY